MEAQMGWAAIRVGFKFIHVAMISKQAQLGLFFSFP